MDDYEVLAGAVGLLRRICQRAGSPDVCRFVYCDAPDMHRLFDTPSDYLQVLYVDGMIMAGCRNFVTACLALGMPDNVVIDQRGIGDNRYDDAPLVLSDEPEKMRNWRAWINNALPGAVIAYICDRDPDMFDFWQRACINFTGRWVVVYQGTTISMGPEGIAIGKSIDYWKQYIIDDRTRAYNAGIEYRGPRRTPKFMQRVGNSLRPETLTVFYYAEEQL